MMASADESTLNFDCDQEECKIKFSNRTSKKTPVFLVNFSNGKLRNNYQSGIKFQCYCSNENSERPSKMADRIFLADNGRLQYTGSSFGNTFESKNDVRYMLGVRNKRKGKMKLYDSVSFRLKPVISDFLKKDVTDKSSANLSFREKRDELTSCFGSKHGKKAMTSRLKYATKDDDVTPIMQELDQLPLQETSKTATSVTPTSTDIIPPRNLHTTNIENVYSINNIISEEEMAALESEAKEINSASEAEWLQWKSDNTFCSFFLHYIENEELSLEKCKLLIYYNYLVTFSKLSYKDFRRKVHAESIPEPYRLNILQNFTLSAYQGARLVRRYPLAMKDKVVAHIMLLALFLCDFKVDFSLILKDVKVTISKLTTIAQVLGCHVTQSKGEKIAHLKLPLYVLPQKQFIKRKK